jgi:hypothetical protein
MHSGYGIGGSLFKGAKDYARQDLASVGLCVTSAACETLAGVIVWVPVLPVKICAISLLKGDLIWLHSHS